MFELFLEIDRTYDFCSTCWLTDGLLINAYFKLYLFRSYPAFGLKTEET